MIDNKNTNFDSAKKFVEFGLKEKNSGNRESASGPGSYIENTKEASDFIFEIVKKYKIKSLLDLGCGDWNWFDLLIERIRKEDGFSDFKYIGWDAHPDLVNGLNTEFGDDNTSFHLSDIVTAEYPQVDLILCRDVLFHMKPKVINLVLDKIKQSRTKYFLSTTFDITKNSDMSEININNNIADWYFHIININIEPYNMKKSILEQVEEKNCSKNNNKRFSILYKLNAVRKVNMNKQFIIGIGSQRAGSTLLHKILDECSPVFMHPVKELHYYDTLFNVRHASVLKKFSNRQIDHILDRIIKSPKHDFIDKRFKCNLRTNMILASRMVEDIEYIDLYRPCVSESEYLGEITPEYMILPEEGIKKMRDDLGADTKIILIARDPVERFISAFKLLKMYTNNSYDMVNFQKDLEDTMDNMPGWIKQQDELNDYALALEKYKKHFNHVLFITFEQLIAEPELVRLLLENFLEVSVNKENYHKIFGKKVNAIGETGKVSKEILTKLNERYKSSIEYINRMKHNESI